MREVIQVLESDRCISEHLVLPDMSRDTSTAGLRLRFAIEAAKKLYLAQATVAALPKLTPPSANWMAFLPDWLSALELGL